MWPIGSDNNNMKGVFSYFSFREKKGWTRKLVKMNELVVFFTDRKPKTGGSCCQINYVHIFNEFTNEAHSILIFDIIIIIIIKMKSLSAIVEKKTFM